MSCAPIARLAVAVLLLLVTSTGFTLLALPAFYQLVHDLGVRWRARAEPRA